MEKIPWFKFYTGFFKRQSVTLISNLRNSDAVIVVLIKLICMATEINDRGYVYITPQRPYKTKELASYMNKTAKGMENILNILKEYGEIEIESNGMIYVTSWSEEQNVDKLELLKKKNRERVAKFRSKKKDYSNITSNLTVTECNASEEDEEENEYENEYEYENIIDDDFSFIISYLNNRLDCEYNFKDKLIRSLILDKLDKGYKKEDFLKVIDNKIKSWKNTPYEKYLIPTTLFGDKFGIYLNEKQVIEQSGSFDPKELKNIGIFD